MGEVVRESLSPAEQPGIRAIGRAFCPNLKLAHLRLSRWASQRTIFDEKVDLARSASESIFIPKRRSMRKMGLG